MMEEIWKPVVGYEDKYLVSNLGRVKSFWTNRLLKPTKRKKTEEYLRVGLWDGKKQHGISLHRLVATAFLPNPNNFPVINHKDENPTNNCVDNLEWCTQQYNTNYGHRLEKFKKAVCGEKHWNYGGHLSDEHKRKQSESLKKHYQLYGSKMKGRTGALSTTPHPIVQLELGGKFVRYWDCIADAYRALKIRNISSVCLGNRHHAGGYRWMYREKYDNYIKES